MLCLNTFIPNNLSNSLFIVFQNPYSQMNAFQHYHQTAIPAGGFHDIGNPAVKEHIYTRAAGNGQHGFKPCVGLAVTRLLPSRSRRRRIKGAALAVPLNPDLPALIFTIPLRLVLRVLI